MYCSNFHLREKIKKCYDNLKFVGLIQTSQSNKQKTTDPRIRIRNRTKMSRTLCTNVGPETPYRLSQSTTKTVFLANL
jgi:hypothetical protein